jgi:hypothetical protein
VGELKKMRRQLFYALFFIGVSFCSIGMVQCGGDKPDHFSLDMPPSSPYLYSRPLSPARVVPAPGDDEQGSTSPSLGPRVLSPRPLGEAKQAQHDNLMAPSLLIHTCVDCHGSTAFCHHERKNKEQESLCHKRCTSVLRGGFFLTKCGFLLTSAGSFLAAWFEPNPETKIQLLGISATSALTLIGIERSEFLVSCHRKRKIEQKKRVIVLQAGRSPYHVQAR